MKTEEQYNFSVKGDNDPDMWEVNCASLSKKDLAKLDDCEFAVEFFSSDSYQFDACEALEDNWLSDKESKSELA